MSGYKNLGHKQQAADLDSTEVEGVGNSPKSAVRDAKSMYAKMHPDLKFKHNGKPYHDLVDGDQYHGVKVTGPKDVIARINKGEDNNG